MSLRADIPAYDTPELESEWQQALKVLIDLGEMEIACAMSVGTRRILFQVVRAMGATDVLDIGTYTGASALAFALTGARVTTVDIRDANAADGHWKNAGRPRSPADTMAAAGVSVEFVTSDSVKYLESTKRTFDFICIDGWHESSAVYAEIPLALERLKPGGLIFLDDVQPVGYTPLPGFDVIHGPRRALERHIKENSPFKIVPLPRTFEGEQIACAFLIA